MATQTADTENDETRFGLRWWQITPLVLLSILIGLFRAATGNVADGLGTALGTLVGFFILTTIAIFLYNLVAKPASSDSERTMTKRTWQAIVLLSFLLTLASVPAVYATVGSVIVGIFAFVFLTLTLITYPARLLYQKEA